MKIIIAPDSFKDGISAKKAGQTILKALNKINNKNNYIVVPISDGGEGLLNTLSNKNKSLYVTGPLGNKVKAYIGFLDNSTIIIEMALSSGLEIVKEEQRNPLNTTSFGLGELILEALKYNPKKIIVGLGGSATNDLGMGALQALGVKFYNKDKEELGIFGKDFLEIDSIDLMNINNHLLMTDFILATDVTNPLTGKDGSSYIYGPQKGLKKEDLKIFDSQFLKVAKMFSNKLNKEYLELEGSGAAGGIAYSLNLLFNGKITPGFSVVSGLLSLKEVLTDADLLITGEGKIDNQTLKGKAPYKIAELAKNINQDIKIIGITGTNNLKEKSIFDMIIEINNKKLPLNENLKRTKKNLYKAILNNKKEFL